MRLGATITDSQTNISFWNVPQMTQTTPADGSSSITFNTLPGYAVPTLNCSDPVTFVQNPACWNNQTGSTIPTAPGADGNAPAATRSVIPGVSNQALVLGVGALFGLVLITSLVSR